MSEDVWLTRQEVADRLKLGLRTVDAKIAAGEIEAVKMSARRVRVSIAAVERYEASLPRAGAA